MRQNSRPRIMRNQEWDPAASELHALDLAQLVFRLFVLDAVHREAALGVVDEPEVLARLLDRDDVHEARGVCEVGPHFAIDLHEALLEDGLRLAVVEGILETISYEDDQWHAVAKLVRAWRRTRRVDAREFVEEPVARRTEALLVLLSARRELSAWVAIMALSDHAFDSIRNAERSSIFATHGLNEAITYGPLPILTRYLLSEETEGAGCAEI
jgi:hypothetical protein